ncbi:MAG TPA: hypothetical protein EYM88_00225 [Gammaproteobacteria bacterium]|nr:hypothetical protein [Gammaproteobacteria bacterium]HIA87653.1 hypothetical protein [Gammaproteobacteria bacterium]HIN58513.1 hypothetical protein [Gammaproteobacteria bacterium]
MTTVSDHVDAFSVGQEKGSGLCSLPIMGFSMRCVVDSFWQILFWVRYHRYSPMMCDGESLPIALASRTLHPLCIGNGVRTTCWPLPNASHRRDDLFFPWTATTMPDKRYWRPLSLTVK